MIMLGQVDDKGISEGVLDHQAVRRIRQVLVGDDGEGVVAVDEAVVLHVRVVLALVDDDAVRGGLTGDLHFDVPRRDIGDHLVRLQHLLGNRIRPRADKAAHIDLFVFAQRHRLEARHLAEFLIGIIGTQRRPVVVGVEVDVFGVVLQQVVEGVDLADILVFLREHVAQDLPLVCRPDLLQHVGRKQHADAGGDRHVEEADVLRRQRVAGLIHQLDMVVGGDLVKAHARNRIAVDDDEVAVHLGLFLAVQSAPAFDHRVGVDDLLGGPASGALLRRSRGFRRFR